MSPSPASAGRRRARGTADAEQHLRRFPDLAGGYPAPYIHNAEVLLGVLDVLESDDA